MFVPKVNVKRCPQRRWAQPDRRFFACGACHVLAAAFLERFPGAGYAPVWIRPRAGFTGNHVFLTDGTTAFDYHGYSRLTALLSHYTRRARRYYPGWDADLVALAPAELAAGGERPGLRLLPPEQFHRDPLRRAAAFVERLAAAPREGAGTGTT